MHRCLADVAGRGWTGCVLAALAVIWLLSGGGAQARDPQVDVEGYLQAGEFGPALQAVDALADAGDRDRWLGRIAVRQAELGARQASWQTLAKIQGDVARRDAVGSLAERVPGAAGGAAMADFDTLINLITTTIAPDNWEETGGAGAVEPFPTGVYVDASGIMQRLAPLRDVWPLEMARHAALADTGNRAVRRAADLRKVSLVRLEKQLQLRHAFGLPPDGAMRALAGVYRIKYLFVYPQTGDIVLAGPAGDWRTDEEGRVVNVDTGIPVLQLDDLVVVLRNALSAQGQFGCAIKPRQERLAATQQFVAAWKDRSVKPSQRDQWLSELRSALGTQDIEVWGIDARTRTARVLVEADYRMKLVGMGLEDGTLGVTSYLDAVRRAGDPPPALNVLRWWFTLNYDGIRTTPARNAFQLDGAGVKVLSENERLAADGARIHTGESDELTGQFARSFTRHFAILAAKYPVYAELKNIFDLALVAGVIVSHDLPGQLDWHLTHFAAPDGYQLALGPPLRQVESVVNAVTVSRSRFFAGVSGGVAVDPRGLVRTEAIDVDDYGLLDAAHASATPAGANLPPDAWWWD